MRVTQSLDGGPLTTATPFCPCVRSAGKLVEAEKRAKGGVGLKVYGTYATAAGGCCRVSVVLIGFVIYHVCATLHPRSHSLLLCLTVVRR